MTTTTFKIRESPATSFIRQEIEDFANPLLKFNKPPIEPLSRGAKRKEFNMTKTTFILVSGRMDNMDVCEEPKLKDKINNLSAWLNLATTILNVVLRVLNLG